MRGIAALALSLALTGTPATAPSAGITDVPDYVTAWTACAEQGWPPAVVQQCRVAAMRYFYVIPVYRPTYYA